MNSTHVPAFSGDLSGIPILACFDIDRTFRMQGDELSQESRALAAALHAAHIPLVAVSGLHFWPDHTRSTSSILSISERIQQGNLPYFPVVIANVGTEMYTLSTENGKRMYRKNREFEADLAATGYSRRDVIETFYRIAQRMNASNQWKHGKLGFQKPEQEREFLRHGRTMYPFKVSGYFFASEPETVEFVRRTFQEVFPSFPVIICEEINEKITYPARKNRKYCVDILPVSKVQAAYYLRNRTRSAIMIRAGDSGNDIDLLLEEKNILFEPGGPVIDISILVGGAEENVQFLFEREWKKATASLPVAAKAHGFRALKKGANRIQFFYKETGGRRGPQSIRHALAVIGSVLPDMCELPIQQQQMFSTLVRHLKQHTAGVPITQNIYDTYSDIAV